MKKMIEEEHIFATKRGKDWLKGILRSEEVTILFTKKDGTERKMLCTLKEDKIPQEFAPKTENREKSEDAIAVFDLEKNSWRSFRFDSIKEVNFSIGTE
jgi:uncharacterized protein YdaT